MLQSPTMYDIEKLRTQEFPLSQTQIYFNHASISPLPTRVKDSMHAAVEGLAAGPAAFWKNELMDLIPRLHDDLVRLINARDPSEVNVITTTSYGLNALAHSFPWEEGDNVLFCEIEFPSNAYPWMSLAREGVEARLVPAVDGGLTLEALRSLVDERTRIVAASAVQFFSGHRTDLMEIGRFCRENNILFVVDAIQAIGHIPIDVQAMNISVLVTGGQKSLLSAPGIGFMYIRSGVCAMLQPRFIGPNATQDYLHWLDYDLTPLPGAARFGMGTPNIVGICGMAASVQLLQELGVANIDRHTHGLVVQAMECLHDLGYMPITPAHAHGPVVTFATGRSSEETDELVNHLAEHNIYVVKHLDAAGNAHIRISFHAYNTVEEIYRFSQMMPARE